MKPKKAAYDKIKEKQDQLHAKIKEAMIRKLGGPEKDINRRLQLQKQIDQIVAEVKKKNQEIGYIETMNVRELETHEKELSDIRNELGDQQASTQEQEKILMEKISELEEEIARGGEVKSALAAGTEVMRKRELEQAKDNHQRDLKKVQKKIEATDKQIQDSQLQQSLTQREVKSLHDQLKESEKNTQVLVNKYEKFQEAAAETQGLKEKTHLLKQHLKEATSELDIVATKYKEEQVKRKRLLNELEDAKGKIRVYCRIRPFSNIEAQDSEKLVPCFKIHDEISLSVGVQKNRIKDYTFDAVFGPNSTQEEVFEDTRRLIQSAIDGYNVVIFAYGQTGSGKTFTIQGSPEKPGLTPRAIVEMFEILKQMSNFDIRLKCYMVELYLNNLRDLLLPKGQPQQELEIKESPTGMIVINGVTEVELNSISQTEQIFEDGLAHRRTRKTNMNDASSRSHLIFSIIVDSTNVNTGVRTIGKLTFVDLAGSEKSAKTGTDAEGQEEANAINLSLSALGNVISALSEGAKFIPYRNHVLTKLMKDSLGGTAKTLMFVNCSPSVYNESETKNSLDYATRVKKIKN